MDFNNVNFKPEFLGKSLKDGNRTILMNSETSSSAKQYIYNMITKNVFDIFKKEEKVEEKETMIIHVKLDKNDNQDVIVKQDTIVEKPKKTRKPRVKKQTTK